MEGRVAIVGLGCVGASIGLALRQQSANLEVVGHDVDAERARKAQQMGAVTRTSWNLPASCEEAGLVILALPLPAVRETLWVLGPELSEGCVVTDTAPLKAPVVAWAGQFLPPSVRFVTGAPIPGPATPPGEPLSGPEAARADLFKGGIYCIAPTLETDAEAIQVLVALAHALGAQPFFTEPLEYDGLQAAVTDLPALLAAALLRATVDSPGWSDLRRMAGHEFAAVSGPSAADAPARVMAAMLNRANLVRRLDLLLDQLGWVRQWLLDGDEQALGEFYAQAAAGRARWIAERAGGQWEQGLEAAAKPPTPGERATQMFFGGLLRRPRREEEGD